MDTKEYGQTAAMPIHPVPVSQAIKMIPVNREALYRKLKAGELPSYRFGRKILVDVNELLAAMRQGAK